MGLRKPVLTKPLNLFENPFGEIHIMAALQHAVNKLVLKWRKAATPLPGGHRSTQLIGFTRGKACSDHRQFNNLFLEDWYTQCPLKHPAHSVV